MEIEVVPLTEFVHGRITAHEGRAMQMNKGIADELERAGLVRISLVPAKKEVLENVPGDGQGQPSSALPAAPASQSKTLHLSKPGKEKYQKTAK